jgi:NAD(P)-dependent dehydrogenase (short-subunit alcohol dehydrogenase family)
MDDLTGRVAVVTGGASGMGRAFADRFARAGMKIVVADVEEAALAGAVTELKASGAAVVGVVCDVSDHKAVVDLGSSVSEAFGPPQVICLNAGVGTSGSLAKTTIADWEWVVGVNLWGIIHGLDVFLSGLRERNEGHVVITASVAGHLAFPRLGPYSATKFAAVVIAETLYAELVGDGSAVGVTCLCPGFVSTNVFTSERNRPEVLANRVVEPFGDGKVADREAFLEWIRANAVQPAEVAEMVYRAVLEGTFWVFTEEDMSAVTARHQSIRERSNPGVTPTFSDVGPFFQP